MIDLEAGDNKKSESVIGSGEDTVGADFFSKKESSIFLHFLQKNIMK